MNKAVFLDRDGTIIEDVGYLNSPDQIQFIPGSIEAIKKLNLAGFKVIVVTNQAGVARGLIAEDMLQTIDKTLAKQILSGGAHLDGIYYCPHHPDHGLYPYKQNCNCRKPNPGMLKRAEKDHNIDLTQSIIVGDKATDVLAGKNLGLKSILVTTGKGAKEQANLNGHADHVADNLSAAVNWLLKSQ